MVNSARVDSKRADHYITSFVICQVLFLNKKNEPVFQLAQLSYALQRALGRIAIPPYCAWPLASAFPQFFNLWFLLRRTSHSKHFLSLSYILIISSGLAFVKPFLKNFLILFWRSMLNKVKCILVSIVFKINFFFNFSDTQIVNVLIGFEFIKKQLN